MEIKAGYILFLDTNILLTATDTSRENHAEALHLFKAALETGFHLCLSGQGMDTAEELLQLTVTHQLKGKRIHDTNVTAVMKSHAVTKLITENVKGTSKFFPLSRLLI